jgi:hypothetical protein
MSAGTKPSKQERRGRKRLGLKDQIQREIAGSQADSLDPSLDAYLDSFFKDFLNNKPLPRLNLRTTESALQALTLLTQVQSQIDGQLRTAQALKKLLEQSKK